MSFDAAESGSYLDNQGNSVKWLKDGSNLVVDGHSYPRVADLFRNFDSSGKSELVARNYSVLMVLELLGIRALPARVPCDHEVIYKQGDRSLGQVISWQTYYLQERD